MKTNNFLNIKFLAALTGSFIGLTGCSTDAELGAGSEVQNSASGLGKNMPAGSFFCNLNLDFDKPSTSWRYEISYTKNTSMPNSVNIVVFKDGKKITTVNAPVRFSNDTAVRYEKQLDKERKMHVTIYKSLPFSGGRHGADLSHQVDQFWKVRSGFCTKK